MGHRSRRWTVVVPLKGGAGAKSRLGGPPGLARALALDTLEAVVGADGVAAVVVVTSDGVTAAASRVLGAQVVPETRSGTGLLAAVADGLAAADPEAPAAVLLGDLPALQAQDLAAALAACARALRGVGSAVVPDAEGTGSVLLAALRPGDLDPAFGPGSAAEHVRRGAVRLDLDLPRLRRDVDTPADLGAVLALGAGVRTRTVVGAIGAAAGDLDPVH
jgi:2-phospho-L-lactate guanylyltransferase